MRYIEFCIIVGVLLCIVTGCAVNPVTGEKEIMLFSDAQEVNLGQNADPDIRWQFGGLYNDPKVTAYVNGVGQKAAAVSHRSNIKYHFAVVDSSVANAFALPGGFIYITRGLLVRLDNEAQLAAVLGHEIAHVTARHGIKRLQTTLGFNILLAIVDQVAAAGSEGYRQRRGFVKAASTIAYGTVALGYSRDNEFQADELGTIYARGAGYNPKGMVQLLGVLKSMHSREPSWIEKYLMSHPPATERIGAVETQITQFPKDQGMGQMKKAGYHNGIGDLLEVQKAYDLYDKAEEHRSKGEFQEALSEYRKSLKIKDIAKPHHGMGLVYHAQGKHSRAIGEYKKSIKIDSEYIFAHNSMGLAYMASKDYKNAVPAFKNAIGVYENFSNAHANLGETYYNLKQYPTAIESLEMAIALNNKHPRAHTNLGLTYEATGNTTKAIEEYKMAVQVAPNEKYTGTARQRLEKLEKAN